MGDVGTVEELFVREYPRLVRALGTAFDPEAAADLAAELASGMSTIITQPAREPARAVSDEDEEDDLALVSPQRARWTRALLAIAAVAALALALWATTRPPSETTHDPQDHVAYGDPGDWEDEPTPTRAPLALDKLAPASASADAIKVFASQDARWRLEGALPAYELHLERGTVLVEFLPKRGETLTVATAQARVAVIGTVFYVSAQREADEEKQKPQNERHELPLIERLKFITQNDFEHITYTQAIDVLLQSKPYKKKKFQYPVEWGTDLQSEHERFLVEKHFKKPVIITDYPKGFKAFYMRLNEDGKTVAAMDVLFPGIGEIMGGSQREERLDVLKEKCAEFNIPDEHVWWYLDTRKFGTCVHSGFGLGFERLMMFVTGMTNIRDVVPFPRTPKNAEF